MSDKNNFKIIPFEDFKNKYKSDNWHKYENESNLFKTSTEKINYWNNKLLEYQKDKINLDYLGTSMLTLDVNLKEPKHLNGFQFDKFCQKNIDLLKLENQIYKPKQTENSQNIKKDWNNEDYYNHYLQTKRFGFGFIKDFKKHQYDEVKQRILEFKELYFFIYNKLPEDSKNEFKFDFLDNLKTTKEKQTLTKFKVIISNLIAEINNQPLQTKTKKPEEVKNNHPVFNPNYWNKECYNLFKYLFDNYYLESTKRTKRQITNIWFFLYEQDKIKYNLKATKDDYKTFIKNKYKIELKNFDKATHKYSTEYSTMNDHRINYEDNFE